MVLAYVFYSIQRLACSSLEGEVSKYDEMK